MDISMNLGLDGLDGLYDEIDMDVDVELDMSWADDFTEECENYSEFYEENVTQVGLRILYVDKNSEIIRVKKETIRLMTPNCVSREELLYIIKTNRVHDDKYYEMLSIAKFNIDLSSSDLKSFLKSNQPHLGDIYLTISHEVDAISFNKTIGALQDLNELLITFYNVKPVSKPNMNVTKRVRFTPHHNKTIKNDKKR